MSIDKQLILYKLAQHYNIPIDQSSNIITDISKIVTVGTNDWCDFWFIGTRLYVHLIKDFDKTNNGTVFMYDSNNYDPVSTSVTF